MAFVLSSKRRTFVKKFDDGVLLEFRYFEGTERDRLQKEIAKIRGTKKFTEKFTDLLRQICQVLLIRWEGVVDEEGKALEPSEEAKKAFFNDAEASKYWERAIMGYMYPSEDLESTSVLPDEADGEPDFLSGK
jgi:hypothetical protein